MGLEVGTISITLMILLFIQISGDYFTVLQGSAIFGAVRQSVKQVTILFYVSETK